MNNSKILYIKNYPPEMGGVSRLGEAVYNKMFEIGKNIELVEVDVSSHKVKNAFFTAIRIVLNIKKYNRIFYSVDSKRTAFFIRLQKMFNKNSLKSTIALIPAYSATQLLKDAPYFKTGVLKELQCIWVETESLKQQLLPYCNNIRIFPNARSIGEGIEPSLFEKNGKLHLLYYSLLSKEKGLYDVMGIVEKLNQRGNIAFDIDFYGNFANEKVESDFNVFLKKNKNARYLGFNDSSDIIEYYRRINKYDIMLFMTHWISEGIPGVCVDVKASGVMILANDHNANRDVILESNQEGIIVKEHDVKSAVDAIEELYNKPDLINIMKKKSYESRMRYDIDSYQKLYDEV